MEGTKGGGKCRQNKEKSSGKKLKQKKTAKQSPGKLTD